MTTPIESSRKRVRDYLARVGATAGCRVEEMPGDASVRRYVRVTDSDGLSRILLVHPDAIDPDTLPFMNVGTLLDRMGVPVPTIRRCEADLGIIELEDLGNVTLQDFLMSASADRRTRCYLEAVGLVDRMQHRGRELASPAFVPFGLAFDRDKLMWELDFFVDHFLAEALGSPPSPDQRAALHDEFVHLTTELASEPRVFCHRDYHSRNLMWHHHRLYVIDFQDARMGPDTYDLVSLLRDCYVDQPATLVDQMIDEFLQLTKRSDSVEFRRRFDVMSVQRHLKALGTFGYQAAVAGTTRYQADVPRTLGYLRSVFEQHVRFDRLRALLAAHVPELE